MVQNRANSYAPLGVLEFSSPPTVRREEGERTIYVKALRMKAYSHAEKNVLPDIRMSEIII